MRVAVLGAGISGIQAGCELAKGGADFVVLESGAEIGGLAQTAQHKRWRYDFGVKALYSKNPQVMDYLLGLPVEYVHHDREVKVHHRSADGSGTDVDYPFENGIGQLPHEDKVACVMGYLEAHAAARPVANFADWVTNRLGAGIAEQFMLPYNRKIWDCPLEEISLGLISGKIHPAPLEEIVRIALGERIVGRQYQARFIYPRAGLSAMMEAMARPIRDRIRTGFRVSRIVAAKRGYEVASDRGDVVHADALISTVPLPILGTLMAPGEWPRPTWRYNNTRFHIAFLSRAPEHKLHWHFFPSPDFPFYRLTYMHNFSDRFAPCVVAEATERGQPDDTEGVVAGLERIGVDRRWIEELRLERLSFTYPIPTKRSDAEKPHVIDFYESRNIYPLGRAGSWTYANVDGIILQAWQKVPEILTRLAGSLSVPARARPSAHPTRPAGHRSPDRS